MDIEASEVAHDVSAEHMARWASSKREGVHQGAWSEALGRLTSLLGGSQGRSIFDVGAGDGGFLASARETGFHPYGNELSSGAIDLAKQAHGIDLFRGDLSRLRGGEQFDSVTMWCVLAHVPDGKKLLDDAYRVLKPGGVLFMQTPRWSALDTAALLALEASQGRVRRVTDMRTRGHHLRFHTIESIQRQLVGQGFEVIDVRARARYSISTARYLAAMGFSPRVSRAADRPINVLVRRELLPRIVLDVYARKSSHS